MSVHQFSLKLCGRIPIAMEFGRDRDFITQHPIPYIGLRFEGYPADNYTPSVVCAAPFDDFILYVAGQRLVGMDICYPERYLKSLFEFDLSYDPHTDTALISITPHSDSEIVKTVTLDHGYKCGGIINLLLDANNKLLALEVVGAREVLGYDFVNKSLWPLATATD